MKKSIVLAMVILCVSVVASSCSFSKGTRNTDGTSSDTFSSEDGSVDKLNEGAGSGSGRDISPEASSRVPMTPEEIASLAYAVRWFDYYSREKGIEWGLEEEICIEEFPDVLFQWSTFSDAEEFGSKITATTDQGTEELYRESAILSVYFCDLTGDGKPELCSTASFGSGVVNYHIIVYDYAQKTSYILMDRMQYDYILRSDQGKLYIDKYAYSVFENETPVETGIPVIKDGQLLFVPIA